MDKDRWSTPPLCEGGFTMRDIAKRLMDLEIEHDAKHISDKRYISALFILIVEQILLLKILEEKTK